MKMYSCCDCRTEKKSMKDSFFYQAMINDMLADIKNSRIVYHIALEVILLIKVHSL